MWSILKVIKYADIYYFKQIEIQVKVPIFISLYTEKNSMLFFLNLRVLG